MSNTPEIIVIKLVPGEENPICHLAKGIKIHQLDPVLPPPDYVEGVAVEGEGVRYVLFVEGCDVRLDACGLLGNVFVVAAVVPLADAN
jgi:hypothetical protein